MWIHKYARQSGGKGQYGHVKIKIEPNPGKGYEFVNAIVGGAIPKEYIPAVDQGIQGAMLSGVLAGYNVVDVKVTLYDGSYHEVDSSEMAFKIAGSMAFKEAMRKADPVLLEPIMKVVVIVPEEYMGDVIGDLNSRRGHDPGHGSRFRAPSRSTAMVPLSEMFGYATDMRSKTQGRGQYTMEPEPLRRGSEVRCREDYFRTWQRKPNKLSQNRDTCNFWTVDIAKMRIICYS